MIKILYSDTKSFQCNLDLSQFLPCPKIYLRTLLGPICAEKIRLRIKNYEIDYVSVNYLRYDNIVVHQNQSADLSPFWLYPKLTMKLKILAFCSALSENWSLNRCRFLDINYS